MSDQYIALLIQVPLVGIFVWFAIRLSADFRADAKLRDDQWRIFLGEQNELWRNFVHELTVRNGNSEDLMSQRLSELVVVIQNMTEDFKAHDARASKRIGAQ